MKVILDYPDLSTLLNQIIDLTGVIYLSAISYELESNNEKSLSSSIYHLQNMLKELEKEVIKSK
jgi:hypothetical protein